MQKIERLVWITLATALWLPLPALAQDAESSVEQMIALHEAGQAALSQDRYTEALDLFRRGLALAKAEDHRGALAEFYSNIGIALTGSAHYQDALDALQHALTTNREIDDASGERNNLTRIGAIYVYLGRYQDAVIHFQQALVIDRKNDERFGEAAGLTNIGAVYVHLGRDQEALAIFQQALVIRREIKDPVGEGMALGNIGAVLRDQGRYQDALDHHQQAVTIFHDAKDQQNEGMERANIGRVYSLLGRYHDALEHFRAALSIARESLNALAEGDYLGEIGLANFHLGRYQEALDDWEQGLVIIRRINAPKSEAGILGQIGFGYTLLGRDDEARESLKQAMAIHKEIGDRSGETMDLLNLSVLNWRKGNTAEALSQCLSNLALQTDLNQPEIIWRIWSNLRQLWSTQSQPGPAILAGKQAVNALQAMRTASHGLDERLAKSFISDKKDVYNGLADLLISQDRYAEAQQVLDMLTESEVYDYIKDESAHDPRRTRADFNAVETEWQAGFDRIVADLRAVGDELAPLTRIKQEARNPKEQAQIDALTARRDKLGTQLQASLDDLLARFAAIKPAKQAKLDAEMAKAHGDKRTMVATLSKQTGKPAALLQTIVLKDKVRLLLTTPNGWTAATAEIDQDTLNTRIDALRRALSDPGSDPVPPARALYDLVVRPIAGALDAQHIGALMVHLDGRLRYIPFGALHDGEQWVAERWPVVVYTAASERREAIPAGHGRIAGLGTTKAHCPSFPELKAARIELDGIVRREDVPGDAGILPGIERLDEAFTDTALHEVATGDYSVVHIASHFDLKPGKDTDSVLLLGTGETMSLSALRHEKLNLQHVDTFTLSACKTALGGADSSGIEIEGLGSIFQHQGARGVIASLWSVADDSTAAPRWSTAIRLQPPLLLGAVHPDGELVMSRYDAAGNRSSTAVTGAPAAATSVTAAAFATGERTDGRIVPTKKLLYRRCGSLKRRPPVESPRLPEVAPSWYAVLRKSPYPGPGGSPGRPTVNASRRERDR